ncbi:hypothetical protein RPHASCH2410_CH12540 [Rhizobium phaseoli Ch24-10]|nr:hypothetical protein RPHASCH2410_CH12540 [Rhizobium phaseoli Ch24-10]
MRLSASDRAIGLVAALLTQWMGSPRNATVPACEPMLIIRPPLRLIMCGPAVVEMFT